MTRSHSSARSRLRARSLNRQRVTCFGPRFAHALEYHDSLIGCCNKSTTKNVFFGGGSSSIIPILKGEVMMRTRRHLFPLALLPLVCALLSTACGPLQNQQPPKPRVALHNSADLTKLHIERFEAGNAAPETLSGGRAKRKNLRM